MRTEGQGYFLRMKHKDPNYLRKFSNISYHKSGQFSKDIEDFINSDYLISSASGGLSQEFIVDKEKEQKECDFSFKPK